MAVPEQSTQTYTEDQTATEIISKQRKSYILTGLTVTGEQFFFDANISQKKPKSKFIFENIKNEDGIAYKAGIRSGDVLLEANGTKVNQLGILELVDAISKLHSFYFTLKRKSRKKIFIQVAFDVMDKQASECEVSTDVKPYIGHIGFYYNVQRDGAYYFPVEIEPMSFYILDRRQRNMYLATLPVGDQRWLNADIIQERVTFTPIDATFLVSVYFNPGAGEGKTTAVVLSPTNHRDKCLAADVNNNLFTKDIGILRDFYSTLDDRFFFRDTRNSSDIVLENSQCAGYYITVHEEEFYGEMKLENDGIQEMTQLSG